jgi:hypothetical protein
VKEISEAGPNLMDLLSLYFQDKGYGTRITTYSGTTPPCLQLQVYLNDRAPWRNFGGEPIKVSFHFNDRKIWYTHDNLYGVTSIVGQFPMGTPEDPELLIRMEGVIRVFMAGAKNLASKMADVVK